MTKEPRFCYPGSVMCGIYAYILYFILGSILYIQVPRPVTLTSPG